VVRELGRVDSTARTAAQTEIGLFWTENTAQQYARVFTNLATYYQLDVLESSRWLALLWTGFAGGAIGVYIAKYTYAFWRPVTAIRAGGGNENLIEDPSWTPRGVTPEQPEYTAPAGAISCAIT